MAARKRIGLSENTRQRIKTSMLVLRLENHVQGKAKMASTQVTAALGLLKKTLPDLQVTQLAGDPDQPLIHKIEQVIIDSRDPQNKRTS